MTYNELRKAYDHALDTIVRMMRWEMSQNEGATKTIRAASVPHGGIFRCPDGTAFMRLMRKGQALKIDDPILCADCGNGQIMEISAIEWVELLQRNMLSRQGPKRLTMAQTKVRLYEHGTREK